ncbi:hypothetical protein SRHO_G00063290 [Serrasalmus rhombeus]
MRSCISHTAERARAEKVESESGSRLAVTTALLCSYKSARQPEVLQLEQNQPDGPAGERFLSLDLEFGFATVSCKVFDGAELICVLGPHCGLCGH